MTFDSMIDYTQGSIVVLPIPFTDLKSQKQRPCMVISRQKSEDVIVLAITSNSRYSHSKFSFTILQKDLIQGNLPKASYIKLQKVFTIHKNLIRKEVCKLDPNILKKVINQFIELIK